MSYEKGEDEEIKDKKVQTPTTTLLEHLRRKFHGFFGGHLGNCT